MTESSLQKRGLERDGVGVEEQQGLFPERAALL